MGRTLGRTLFVLSLVLWTTRLAAADSIELSNRALELQRAGDGRQAIELYSRALEEGGLPDGFLAALYNNRAAAYTKEGFYDLALQDFGRSLELSPESVPVLNNRGALYAKMGHYSRALADYGECLRLKPDFGKAYSNRGNAQFYLQRYAEAVDDYLDALRFGTTDRYRTVIFLYLARARLGADGRDELRANLRTLPKDEWPAPVAMMFLGALAPQQMLAAAVSDEPRRDRERKAEALFYLGYHALLAGDSVRAMAYFRRAAQADEQYLVEITGARAELGLKPVALAGQPPAAPAAPESAPESAPVTFVESRSLGEPLGAAALLADASTAEDPVPSNGGAAPSFEPALAAVKQPTPSPAGQGGSAAAGAPDSAMDGPLIHLMSLKSKADAEDSAEALRRRFSDLMGPAAVKISRVDLGAEGIVYRVVAGPYATRGTALAVCEQVRERAGSQYCGLMTY